MLPILTLATSLAAPSMVIGFLIGFAGIGGVLLAPALSVIGEIPIHDAIRLCMWVYVLAGVVGTAVFLRNGYISKSMFLDLAIGACPGALAGALVLNLVGPQQIEFAIAAVIFLSGVNTFSTPRQASRADAAVGRTALMTIGALTGFSSSMTGTGGPLILIPILLFLGVQVKQTIGLAQAIQIPIGVVATAGNLLSSDFDFLLGSILAVTVGVGVLAGASVAHRFSSTRLKGFMGVVLILIALFYGLYGVHKILT